MVLAMTMMMAAAKRRGRKPVIEYGVDPLELTRFYEDYFTAFPADTPELQRAAWYLRYQVLCVERQIFPVEAFPEQLENDEDDSRAVQALLCHQPDQRMAGAMRLILPKTGSLLPCLRMSTELAQEVPAGSTAELSRFVIIKEFRRRWDDGDYGAVNDWLSSDHQRRIPHCSLGLMRVMLQLAREHNITHVCALAEPALLRLLQGLGLFFAPVGDLVSYHGMRQPCYAKLDTLLRRQQMERPEIWHFITEGGKY